MDVVTVRHQFVEEGFDRVFAWTNIPGARYSDHSHPGTSVHVVLSEEIAITTAMGIRVFRSGERFDVGAGDVHSAQAGPESCI